MLFSINEKVKFNIDPRAEDPFEYFTKKSSEMIEEMKGFIRFSKGRKCFLDIGAFCGVFSLVFLALNKTGKAVAADPSPMCIELLNIHSELNPEFDLRIWPSAFGNKEQKQEMHFEWYHLIANHSSSPDGLQIDMNSLDHFVSETGISPDTIKIDVEGFEYQVLEGGSDFLEKNSPLIFLETHGEWIERYGKSYKDLILLLAEFGYEFFTPQGEKISAPENVLHRFCYRTICSKGSIVKIG